MARIKNTTTPMDFRSLKHEGALTGDTNDCAVIAVAVACGVPYKEAQAALTLLGRRMRGGTQRNHTRRAIEQFGFRIVEWTSAQKIRMIHSYPSPHNRLHGITSHHPRRFPAQWATVHNNMLLFSRRHVLALKNGAVQDWSINNALRIGEVWEVHKR